MPRHACKLITHASLIPSCTFPSAPCQHLYNRCPHAPKTSKLHNLRERWQDRGAGVAWNIAWPIGRCTMEAIWQVVAYSLRVCMHGRYPNTRHDGVPFSESSRPGDKQRALLARMKAQMHVKACLVQKRGDWQWLQQVFVPWQRFTLSLKLV